MKLKTRKIKHCLLCKNKNIKKIFSLGNLFVSNFVKKKNVKTGIKAPLNLLYCKNCSLIQLSHIAPQEIMYRKFYWHRIFRRTIFILQKNFQNEEKYKISS